MWPSFGFWALCCHAALAESKFRLEASRSASRIRMDASVLKRRTFLRASRRMDARRAASTASNRDPGPGDIGGIPDMADLAQGIGQENLEEDQEATMGQLGEAADDVIEEPDEMASEALHGAHSGVETVAESLGRSAITDALKVASNMPQGLASNVPESPENVNDYDAMRPTPRPAQLGGVFCRGGACRYRKPDLFTNGVAGGQVVAGSTTAPPDPEFCRGLACDADAGFPSGGKLSTFVYACMRLFTKVGGGLAGSDGSRTIADARDSFDKLCPSRVHPAEAAQYCSAYSDVVVGALAPELREASVGDVQKVCVNIYEFVTTTKRASIDMKLYVGALKAYENETSSNSSPQGHTLLMRRTNGRRIRGVACDPTGAKRVGPNSARGRQWQTWLAARGRGLPPPKKSQGRTIQFDAATEDPLGAAEAETYVDTMEYNPPCNTAFHNISHDVMKYQIVPGQPDGTFPPIEVSGDEFGFCMDQVKEIGGGHTHSAQMTVQMTRDWCNFQAAEGKPEWTETVCSGMGELMSFALRDQLQKPGAVETSEVCRTLFLATGLIRRFSEIVGQAWIKDLRGAPIRLPFPPLLHDAGMVQLMAELQEASAKMKTEMEKQRKAKEEIENAKKEIESFTVTPDNLAEQVSDLTDLVK